MALTTVAKIMTIMGESGLGDQNATTLKWFIDAIETHIKNRVGRDVLKSASVTEYHNGDGRTAYFHTDEFPVTAVTSVHDDTDYPHTYAAGYLVDADDYEWYEHGLVELVTGTFNKGLKNIKIIYTAGYATIPKDLERLATEWTVLAFKGKDKLGVNSQSAMDGSQTFFDRFLTPDLLAILHSYEDRASGLCI